MKRSPGNRTVCARRRRCSQRGMSLLETLISGAITVAVMGTALGVYVTGTRSYYREQAQSYVQFRTRTTLDNIAREVRSAKAFLPFADVPNRVYANDGKTGPACLILQVPSQDSQDKGVFFYGSGTSTQNALVTDLIVYRHNPADQTLRCTIVPSKNVLANDGKYHNSYREAMQDAVIARNVSTLGFRFKDRDGAVITAGRENRTASIDIVTEVKQARQVRDPAPSGVAVSGVRLRNMRSGSIPGVVMAGGAPVSGARLQALYTGSMGAYEMNTLVGEALSDVNGNFEIYGLEPGMYSLKAQATGRATTSIGSINVPEEEAAQPVTVTMQ